MLAAVALLSPLLVAWQIGDAWASDTPRPFPAAVPPWAIAANDVGPSDDSFEAEGELFLPLRDPQGAADLAEAVSTPGNPLYRHFVSPSDWINRFAPTQDDFDSVVDFLKSQGSVISATPVSRQYVVFRERISVMESSFHTTMHSFRLRGQHLVAPARPPSLPASLAAKVSGIVLGQGRPLARRHAVGLSGSTPQVVTSPGAGPSDPPVKVIDSMLDCSPSWGSVVHTTPPAYGSTQFPTAVCAYPPDAIRRGLGLAPAFTSGINGAGQTVAVVNAYAPPDLVGDVNRYAKFTKISPLLPSGFRRLVPDSMFNDVDLCGGPAGWQEEDTMDVEAVHVVAPAAHIVYAAGFNCGAGVDYAVSAVLDTHAADIVTNSYSYIGEDVPTDLIAGETNLFLQAAAEGIGMYFASGDDGDLTKFHLAPQPSWPSSSPWVTAVGGTTMAIAETDAAAHLVFESGWGNRIDDIVGADDAGAFADPLPGVFNAGSGGGVSTVFPQPRYQRGVVPTEVATNASGQVNRAAPDVATDANPVSSMLIGYTPIGGDGLFEVKLGAGTSLASPLMAGKVALAQQAAGRTIGFANPALYARYRAAPQSFGDIRELRHVQDRGVAVTEEDGTRQLFTIDADSSLKVRDGFDTVTGLGDPGLDTLQQTAATVH